jgi:hypothetical protein
MRPTRKALAIFAGYNLPFLLWTDWAVFRIVVPAKGFCLTRKLLPFLHDCHGCGLTGQYSSFLTGHPASAFFYVVFGLFTANLFWSLFVLLRQTRSASEAAWIPFPQRKPR